MGGEKNLSGTTDNRPQGSPPRGRGKDAPHDEKQGQQGITPAWAGKSSRVAPTPRIAGDHPRAGGEKPTRKRWTRSTTGSPPRWRGKALLELPRRTAARDHPRIGGEKMVISTLTICSIGSPPRGRGKADTDSSGSSFGGITPAWAGKSCSRGHGESRSKDHPRMGGENSCR